jgi:hypothetical protein
VNPDNPGYESYGGRGIKFAFKDVRTACDWVVENLGLKKGMSLDRIDNNGDYAPGNLRWATNSDQLNNTRASILKKPFNPQEWPYSAGPVRRYLKQGMSREQVLDQARKAVVEKRKGWRVIAEKLESMTS